MPGDAIRVPACPLGSHCWGDSCCPSPLHRDGWIELRLSNNSNPKKEAPGRGGQAAMKGSPDPAGGPKRSQSSEAPNAG